MAVLSNSKLWLLQLPHLLYSPMRHILLAPGSVSSQPLLCFVDAVPSQNAQVDNCSMLEAQEHL